MKPRSLAALALATGLALGGSGCASLGMGGARPLTAHTAQAALTVGASNKADVTQALGVPTIERFRSGHEIWVYRYKAGLPMFMGALPVIGPLASGVDAVTSERELAILFDPQGIVSKYRLREAPSTVERLLAAPQAAMP